MSKFDHLTPENAPYVKVNWDDICTIDNWNEHESDWTPAAMASAGWLLEDDPKWIIIATNYDYDEGAWSLIRVISKSPPTITFVTNSPA